MFVYILRTFIYFNIIFLMMSLVLFAFKRNVFTVGYLAMVIFQFAFYGLSYEFSSIDLTPYLFLTNIMNIYYIKTVFFERKIVLWSFLIPLLIWFVLLGFFIFPPNPLDLTPFIFYYAYVRIIYPLLLGVLIYNKWDILKAK